MYGCIQTGDEILSKDCKKMGNNWEISACYTEKASVYTMRNDLQKAIKECEKIKVDTDSSGTLCGYFGAICKFYTPGYNYCITKVAMISKNMSVCNKIEYTGWEKMKNWVKSLVPNAALSSLSKQECISKVIEEKRREHELTNIWNNILNP